MAPTPPAADTLLDIRDLEVGFAGRDTAAVRNVSLSLRRGEVLALVGESGSGKSVTVKAVMRLIDFQGGRITRGQILLASRSAEEPPQDLATLSERGMRRIRGARIAMIFQDPMTSLNPVMKIGAQIMEALRQQGEVFGDELRARAMELLEQVRLTEPARRFDQYPHELSGGMRQRIMIAMALASKPDLLIADEPTTALDVTVQAEILALIRSLQKSHDMAVLFITHDMGVVAEIADRVAVMLRGEVIEQGEVRSVFDAPAQAYTRSLLAAAPKFRDAAAAPAELPPPPVERPVVSVQNLCARYPIRSGILRRHRANVHAVENVSFEIRPGETLALIGESGCGKSSLARTLLRLTPASEGRAWVGGRDLLSLPPAELREARGDIQMIFQDPYASLDPRMTVRKILEEPARIRGLPLSAAELDARLRALVTRVGLPEDSLARYPHQFSGGQRQRICIARALVVPPKVLIADEPVSALDVAIQGQILELLGDLRRDQNLALLFISHDMAVVEKVADRIMVMHAGRVVEQGPAARVLSNPAHPYTRRLLQAVPVSHPAQRFRRESGPATPGPVIRPLGTQVKAPIFRNLGDDHLVLAEEDSAA